MKQSRRVISYRVLYCRNVRLLLAFLTVVSVWRWGNYYHSTPAVTQLTTYMSIAWLLADLCSVRWLYLSIKVASHAGTCHTSSMHCGQLRRIYCRGSVGGEQCWIIDVRNSFVGSCTIQFTITAGTKRCIAEMPAIVWTAFSCNVYFTY